MKLKALERENKKDPLSSDTGETPVPRSDKPNRNGIPKSSTAVSAVQSGTGVPPVQEDRSMLDSQSDPSSDTGETPVLRFFNPYDEIAISQRNLPHWHQENALYFVTFRLADAVPAGKLEQWKNEKEQWLRQHPEPWSEDDIIEYSRLFPERINQWLDAGSGSCILQKPAVSKIVESSLKFFETKRYRLFDHVIMPNHVHVLAQPLFGHKLDKILHSWKSFTAHQINKKFNQTGSVWQDESYDHIVRSEAQLHHYKNYIAENPIKAKLKPGAFRLHSTLQIDQPKSSTAVPAVQKESGTGETPVLHSNTPPKITRGEP